MTYPNSFSDAVRISEKIQRFFYAAADIFFVAVIICHFDIKKNSVCILKQCFNAFVENTSRGIKGSAYFFLFAKLKKLGVNNTVMLTGDSNQTAEKVSRELGLSSYKAELLPADKLKNVQQIKENSKSVIFNQEATKYIQKIADEKNNTFF